MWPFIKVLFILVGLGCLAFVAYAFLGPVFFPDDFAAPKTDITRPVVLEIQ